VEFVFDEFELVGRANGHTTGSHSDVVVLPPHRVAEEHRDGEFVPVGEPLRREREEVRNARQGDRDRMQVHPLNLVDDPFERDAVRDARLVVRGEGAANGPEEEGSGAACWVEESLSQGVRELFVD